MRVEIGAGERPSPDYQVHTDVLALPDLSGYGEVAVAKGPDLHEVPDGTAAAEQTGLAVPEVTRSRSAARMTAYALSDTLLSAAPAAPLA